MKLKNKEYCSLGGDTLEKLMKDFEPMVHSICKKFSNNYEYEDLVQEAFIAVLEAYETYNPNKNMKLESWIYNHINWRCLELVSEKRFDTISINSVIESKEGDTIELLDLLACDIDIEADAIDKEMISFYKREITRVLPKDKSEILIDKYFHNCVGIPTSKISAARNLLIKKSPIYREEWKKLKHISDYKAVLI